MIGNYIWDGIGLMASLLLVFGCAWNIREARKDWDSKAGIAVKITSFVSVLALLVVPAVLGMKGHLLERFGESENAPVLLYGITVGLFILVFALGLTLKTGGQVRIFVIALVISGSVSILTNRPGTPILPSMAKQLRERCGVPANIDTYATCLANKHKEDREQDSLLTTII